VLRDNQSSSPPSSETRLGAAIWDGIITGETIVNKVYKEKKKATSTMVSPVIIHSRLAAPGSPRMGETKILSLGMPKKR